MDDFISIKYKKFCHFIDIIHWYNYIFANPSLHCMVWFEVKCDVLFLTFTVKLVRDLPIFLDTNGRSKKGNKVGSAFWKISFSLQQIIWVLLRYGLKHFNCVFFRERNCVSIVNIFTIWGGNIRYVRINTSTFKRVYTNNCTMGLGLHPMNRPINCLKTRWL